MKPENILLTGNEDANGLITIKLTDFGLSAPLQEGEHLKELLGSPLYMSPEIIRKEDYNEKVDIWGIGIVAHILLSGCPPFDGKTHKEIETAILNK